MVPCYCTFAESAQQERIAQISDYLNDGFSEGLYVGGGPVTVMYQRAMSGTLLALCTADLAQFLVTVLREMDPPYHNLLVSSPGLAGHE